jgi:acetyl-CoA acetyltransferase
LKSEDIDGAINAVLNAGGGARGDWTDAFPRILGMPVKFYFHVGRGGAPATFSLISALKFLELGIAKYVVVAYGIDDWTLAHANRETDLPHGRPRSGTWGLWYGDAGAACHHSFVAARHMHEYGTTSEQLGAIAVQTRAWACLNPNAYMYDRPMTIEDHQNSPIVAWPYHLLDVSIQTDGAVAFVVTTADRAKDCRKPPVYVKGIGFGEHIRQLWWDKGFLTALDVQPAKDAAFKQAGVELQDIDCAQLYDCFTGEVLLQLEDYGWCKKGEGGPFAQEGHMGPGGDIPINTSGGLLSAFHLCDFTGFSEAIIQLRAEAGARQVKDAELCMVTGHGGELVRFGICSTHTCLILGR